MRKIITVLGILLIPLFTSFAQSSLPIAWGNADKSHGIIFTSIGNISILKYSSSKMSIIDEKGDVQKLPWQWPAGWRLLDAIDHNDEYIILIINNLNLSNYTGTVEIHKMRKDDYSLSEDFSTIDEYTGSLTVDVHRNCKLKYSEDSTKIYLMFYNLDHVARMCNIKHLVVDNQWDLLWTRSGYPTPEINNASADLQIVTNDGEVYYTFIGYVKNPNTKKNEMVYHIMGVNNEGDPIYSFRLPTQIVQINVNLKPMGDGVVLLSGFLRERYRDDALFVSYLIDLNDNTIVGSSKEKFALDTRKDFIGESKPMLERWNYGSWFGRYYTFENETIQVLHFLGYGDAASYIIMHMNENGEITSCQFLNNPETSKQFVQRDGFLHFLYIDNIKNYTSKKIIDSGKNAKKQCLTYIKYNIKAQTIEKQMIEKLADLKATEGEVVACRDDGFLVVIKKGGKYYYGAVAYAE
ncbi:hypothetical protein LJC68_03540 [Bacteroidales bacterium OttesenSCG-928-B11]|nr:hypothetical protein [Bacteroidales bacterium OttesenSCG-928-E04]MDL2308711.1 hypothetical protein [Bacteroidales bacterium OttesenSCG-928-C03]MDL2311934.1 hypothetical protein [Bacteroidales bacterium OttesenSCG-928-B11]